jgi:hypothetical protein
MSLSGSLRSVSIRLQSVRSHKLLSPVLLGLTSATRTTTRSFTTLDSHILYPTTPQLSSLRSMSSYSLPAKPEWSTPVSEGATVPSVTFKTRVRIESDDENPFDWKDVSTDDLFADKRVVLFALPGAFTPTCKLFRRNE